jgi:hypothetical protein
MRPHPVRDRVLRVGIEVADVHRAEREAASDDRLDRPPVRPLAAPNLPVSRVGERMVAQEVVRHADRGVAGDGVVAVRE